MNKIMMVLIISIISICWNVYPKVERTREVVVDLDTLLLDSTVQTISEEQLKRHVDLFDKISCIWNTVHNKKNDVQKKKHGRHAHVSRNRQDVVTYTGLDQYSISSICFTDESRTPTKIEFETSLPRSFTVEEAKEYEKTSKFPESYCTVSEKTAIERAQVFLDGFYGAGASNRYDSVAINYLNKGDYYITFSVKIRNDICDWHNSSLTINANTGEIESFFGSNKPFLADSDYSYTPKISRQHSIQMYADECKKMLIDCEIAKIFLVKDIEAGKPHWKWQIYGTRKNKNIPRAGRMIIDSETGEVIRKDMH